MGRAGDLRARQEAELAVVELEDRLLDLKADPEADPAELAQAKLDLREARRAFRELREAAPPEAAGGAAVARPVTVKASTSVKRPGGRT